MKFLLKKKNYPILILIGLSLLLILNSLVTDYFKGTLDLAKMLYLLLLGAMMQYLKSLGALEARMERIEKNQNVISPRWVTEDYSNFRRVKNNLDLSFDNKEITLKQHKSLLNIELDILHKSLGKELEKGGKSINDLI